MTQSTEPTGSDYSPTRDGHLLVLGDRSGNTEALRAVAISALDRGELVLVVWGSEANTTMSKVATEVQRRYELVDDSAVEAITELPAAVRPKPFLVLVDDADALTGDAPDGSTFRWSLAEVLGLGSGVDVHVAAAFQTIEDVVGYELLIGQFGTLIRPPTTQDAAA